MHIFSTHTEVRSWLSGLSSDRGLLGLVPTMGALHDGHLSLIRQCREDNELTAVSIFVNPTQFNDKKDFETYPRDLNRDLELLRNLECDMVFTPDETEMYPEEDNRKFDFGNLDKIMEGRFRPGHFNGVAQIVSKLLTLILPDRAYFGEKDFQQLMVIRSLVKMMKYPVEIVGCPIIREADGLAMSSRNRLLSDQGRNAASRIPETLFKVAGMKSRFSPAEVKQQVISYLNKNSYLEVEYFEITDEEHLKPVQKWNEAGHLRAFIAVLCAGIRLIDNIHIPR